MAFRMVLVPFVCLMAPQLAWGEPPLKLVDELDLQRYQGRWYEIARLPNRFQDDCVSDVQADYRLRDDDRVAVTNRCRRADGSWTEAEGVARLADRDGPAAALEVRFAPRWLSWLPMVWGDYRVLALGDDYEYALVGTEDRDYLWILARQPELNADVLQGLIERARAQGFSTERLLRQPHTAP